MSSEEQQRLKQLGSNWVWVSNWVDSQGSLNTHGRVVSFTREFTLPDDFQTETALLHFSADTRYKLFVNGVRVAVGPTRGSEWIWYYDSLDIGPWLVDGDNVVEFLVLRYFNDTWGALPFERTEFPGLTVIGDVVSNSTTISMASASGWKAVVNNKLQFPHGLVDDGFLHIFERLPSAPSTTAATPTAWGIGTATGIQPPWRLRARPTPMPVESPLEIVAVHNAVSSVSDDDWMALFTDKTPVTLPASSTHTIELQAEAHSTAYIKWSFQAAAGSTITLKVTYSEGYENTPISYPGMRNKTDRLNWETGLLLGPYDQVTLTVDDTGKVSYEPFWWRCFRIQRFEFTVGSNDVTLLAYDTHQTNYPLDVKASWEEPGSTTSGPMWDVSIRTIRNCLYDGYSDCPFYEQLQYSGDSRSSGLFHYLLSGDDRLMRVAISFFGSSMVPQGISQSRFPCHQPQLIAGYPLIWILEVCDHHLYFGDDAFARSFLPQIDSILAFFDSHIDSLGLVSGLPANVWQYVDWVTTWVSTATWPDKGVPLSGRTTNRFTYNSMLYAYVLQQVAPLVRLLGRSQIADDYETRAASLVQAIKDNCYDGTYFTDSTTDIADSTAYSQHSQVFGVLCGAVDSTDIDRLLTATWEQTNFSKCSFFMTFYSLRAYSMGSDSLYNTFWGTVWDPWHLMLTDNMSTWEEDDVRQRSDCHAWGSVPIYEFCTQVAGVQVTGPGCSAILFKPRPSLSANIKAQVALGADNLATVAWTTADDGTMQIELQLQKAIEVASELPGGVTQDHGVVSRLSFSYLPSSSSSSRTLSN